MQAAKVPNIAQLAEALNATPSDLQRDLTLEEMRAVAVHAGYKQYAKVDFTTVDRRVKFFLFYMERDKQTKQLRLPLRKNELSKEQLKVVNALPEHKRKQDYIRV